MNLKFICSSEQLQTLLSTQLQRVIEWELTQSTPASNKWEFKNGDEKWNSTTLVKEGRENTNVKYVSFKVWK